MQYYDIDRRDFAKFAFLRGDEWNRFCDSSLRSTCTFCGKDYNYGSESPVLKDPVWREAVDGLGLSGFEKAASERFRVYYKRRLGLADSILKRMAYKIGFRDRKSLSKAYAASKHLSAFLLPVPDDCHCTLCVECMERGLGRPLDVSDIDTECGMGRRYAERRFGNC